jgi:hypothetical protein
VTGAPTPERAPAPRQRLRADTVTAAAAVLVAVAALFVTIWDGIQTRQHNRLTVMPKLSLNLDLESASNRLRATLTLTNNGLGPALFEASAIRFRGARRGDGFYTSWLAFKDSLMAPGLNVTRALDLARDEAIALGRAYVLLAVEADSTTPPDAMYALFENLAVRIRYRSVYGDLQEVTIGEDPPPLEAGQETSSAASTRSLGNAARGFALLCANRIRPCSSMTMVPLS